jgi:hypothetical protein
MTYQQELKAFKIAYWKKILSESKGNVSLAAKISGTNRTHVHRIIIQFDLKPQPVALKHTAHKSSLSWSTQSRIGSKYA